VTSNTSEAVNAMLDDYRGMGWLGLIDGTLGHMSKRISKKRNEYRPKRGGDVVPRIKELLFKRWNACIQLDVDELTEGEGKFKVDQETESQVFPVTVLHNVVKPGDAECTCGKWQDVGYPCIHGMAYYRKWEEKRFEMVLEDNVSYLYKFSALKHVYRKNICPVVLDVIRHEGSAKPPAVVKTAGRPRTKRIRNRSKFLDPSNSNIRCSRCGKAGHNVRTCERREEATGGTEEANTQTLILEVDTVNQEVRNGD